MLVFHHDNAHNQTEYEINAKARRKHLHQLKIERRFCLWHTGDDLAEEYAWIN